MFNQETGAAVARRPEEKMARWTPWDEMNEIRHRMDELFSNAFGYTPLHRMIPNVEMDFKFEPPIDLYVTDEMVKAFVALPGYKPEEINIEVKPDMLMITGERKPLFENDKAVPHKAVEVTGVNRFNFCQTLPAEIDINKVKAVFANGVLELEMLKTPAARNKGVKVPIEGK